VILNGTYKGYDLQIVTVEHVIPPRKIPMGPWTAQVRVYWKENGNEKREVFRTNYSSAREQDAAKGALAQAKSWID
jgi:hypothetical protein